MSSEGRNNNQLISFKMQNNSLRQSQSAFFSLVSSTNKKFYRLYLTLLIIFINLSYQVNSTFSYPTAIGDYFSQHKSRLALTVTNLNYTKLFTVDLPNGTASTLKIWKKDPTIWTFTFDQQFDLGVVFYADIKMQLWKDGEKILTMVKNSLIEYYDYNPSTDKYTKSSYTKALSWWSSYTFFEFYVNSLNTQIYTIDSNIGLTVLYTQNSQQKYKLFYPNQQQKIKNMLVVNNQKNIIFDYNQKSLCFISVPKYSQSYVINTDNSVNCKLATQFDYQLILDIKLSKDQKNLLVYYSAIENSNLRTTVRIFSINYQQKILTKTMNLTFIGYLAAYEFDSNNVLSIGTLNSQYFLRYKLQNPSVSYSLYDSVKLPSNVGAFVGTINSRFYVIGCINGSIFTTQDIYNTCPIQCKQCSAGDNCTSCQNSLKDPATKCLNCLSGYGYNLVTKNCQLCGSDEYSNLNTCKKCLTKCATCSNGTSCSSCKDPNTTLAASCQPCASNQYWNVNVCASCDPKCATCSNGTSCLTCKLNNTNLARSCQPCASTQYWNVNACASCDPKCATCSSGTICLTCKQNNTNLARGCQPCASTQFWNVDTCSSCDSKCATCSNGTSCNTCKLNNTNLARGCQPCASTQFWSVSTCLSCDPKCASCSNATSCDTCKEINTNSARNCQPCASTQFWNVNICLPCNSKCATCSNGTSCDTCKLNNTNLARSCQPCASNQFWSVNTCLLCDSKCASCSNGTSCDICKHNNTNLARGCQPCASTQFWNVDTCSSCDSKCATCSNGTSCNTCKLNNTNLARGCQPCASTQFWNQNTCSPCDPKCSTCSNSTICLACKQVNTSLTRGCQPCSSSQFWNVNTCSSCDQKCATCSNGTTCLTCKLNNTNLARGCQPCASTQFWNVNTCSSCDPKCATCSNGSSCLTCKQNNTNLARGCEPCAANQFWNINTCSLCDSKCATCLDGITCTQCKLSFLSPANNCTVSCDSLDLLSCDLQNSSVLKVRKEKNQCVAKSLISSIPNCQVYQAVGENYKCIKCNANAEWTTKVIRNNLTSTECVLKTIIQFGGPRCSRFEPVGQTHRCSICQTYYRLIPIQQNGIFYNTCIHQNAVILTTNCLKYVWKAQLTKMICQSCSNPNDSLVPVLSGKSTPLTCVTTSLILSIPNCFSYRFSTGVFYCLACKVGYIFDLAKICNQCAAGYTKSTSLGSVICSLNI